MQKSIMVFIFSYLDWKYPFYANLVQKVKIVSLSWNLVARLIQIYRIQWWCSLFVLNQKYLRWANLLQKFKIVSLRWNLVPRLICVCRIQCWYSVFSFLTRNTLFGQFDSKNQIFLFKVNFGTQTNSNMQNLVVVFTLSVLHWK